MMALTFALLAFVPNLEKQAIPFLLIYGFSFFFTEFGPNATTFVYPAEIFPVKQRTTGHGIAAATGSLLGLLVTATLLPETKGRSLEEISGESNTTQPTPQRKPVPRAA